MVVGAWWHGRMPQAPPRIVVWKAGSKRQETRPEFDEGDHNIDDDDE